jgi:hypothetical protein
MSTRAARWELDEIELSASAVDAALNVVARLTREREELTEQWTTAIRLAQANGASLRQIALAAGVSPQTVANACNR